MKPSVARFRLPLLVVLVLSLACEDSPSAPQGDPSDGIGPEGGTVNSPDGRARLVVPEGAFADTVDVTVVGTAAPLAHPNLIDETVFRVQPTGTSFAVPATLRIEYDEAFLAEDADEADLRIHVFEVGSGWSDAVAHVSVDGTTNQVTAQISTGGVYALLLVDDAAPDTGTAAAYIVDPPLPVGVRYFTEVAPALAYVCTLPPDTVPHEIVVRTSRALRVGRIGFDCDVRLRIDDGWTPSLAAPVDSAMHIEADGALVLSGMTIDAPLGLFIDAARRFEITDNTVHGETVIGVVDAAATVPARATAAAPTAWDGGGVVSGNTFTDDFSLEYRADVGGAVDYQVTGNSAPEATIGGAATVGGSVHVETRANVLDGLHLDLRLDAAARATVSDHLTLSALDGTVRSSGEQQFDITGNVVGEADLTFDGVGSGTFRLEANDITNPKLRFGLAHAEFESTGDVFGDLVLGVVETVINAPRLDFAKEGGSVGAIELTSDGVTDANAQLGLRLSGSPVAGAIEGGLTAPTLLELEDLTVGGALSVGVTGNALDVQAAQVQFGGALNVSALGVNGSLGFHSTGGTFNGGILGADHAAYLNIALIGPVSNAPMFVGHGTVPGGFVDGSLRVSRAPGAGEDSVVIENAVITASGNNAINLEDVDGSIRITGGTLTSSLGGIWVGNAAGDVHIEGVTLIGGGISVDSTDTHVVIRDITLTQTATLGFSATGSSDVLIDDVQVTATGLTTSGVTAFGSDVTVRNSSFSGHMVAANASEDAHLTLEGVAFASGALPATMNVSAGAQLTATGSSFANVYINIGDGYASFLSGNSVSGATGFIMDMTFGGLVVDPVDNNAISDGSVATIVDFDGNGCAEHPASYNYKDPETGVCGLDGQPPRSP